MKMDADPWNALERALGEFAASGTAEVHEDGEWLAGLAGFQYELRRTGKDTVVHRWSDGANLTRRILPEVGKFGRTKPVKLEFIRKEAARTEIRVSREQFRARFERILAERFPAYVVDSLTAAPNLEHFFFRGVHARVDARRFARLGDYRDIRGRVGVGGRRDSHARTAVARLDARPRDAKSG